MPELPEITNLARQMDAALAGRRIAAVEVMQAKSLNVSEEAFSSALVGAEILAAGHHGKWLRVQTDRGWLLLNLGMGGEVLLTAPETLPEKRRLVFALADGACLAINFWWVGYAHYVAPDGLAAHEMTARLGPEAVALSADDLRQLFSGKRGRVKNYLLDQSCMAGIGNFYVHDILFTAGLHPLRTVGSLTPAEIERLAAAIHGRLELSIGLGGAAYELDLYGQHGRFDGSYLQVAYREGEPCPTCGTAVIKIRTGSTPGFICPQCQPLS